MMSMHSSTHSSQMNTVGPAISLRTSCWLLPQNEQYRVFFASPPAVLLILRLRLSPIFPAPQTLPGPIGRAIGTIGTCLSCQLQVQSNRSVAAVAGRSRSLGLDVALGDDLVDQPPVLG